MSVFLSCNFNNILAELKSLILPLEPANVVAMFLQSN